MNILVKLALPLLISLAIDGQTVLASDKVEVIDASKVQRFAMDPFKDSEGQNPIFYTEWTGILGRFGEPPNTEETKVAERTSDEILTTHWLQYDGLTIGIVESEDKEHSWLETVVISGNARPLKFGIEIGTAFSDLVTLLQIPPPRYRAKSAALYLLRRSGGIGPTTVISSASRNSCMQTFPYISTSMLRTELKG